MDSRCNGLDINNWISSTSFLLYVFKSNSLLLYQNVPFFALLPNKIHYSLGVYLTANNYSYYKNRHDYEQAENPLDKFLTNGNTWLGLLIILSVVLIILLLMLIFLRKRIYLAIGLIEEGSK